MARRLWFEVRSEGATFYTFGGVGVWLAVREAGRLLLVDRPYRYDIDAWSTERSLKGIDLVLTKIGFCRITHLTPSPHRRYCLSHSGTTVAFHLYTGQELRFCHGVSIPHLTANEGPVLPATQLLLTKLQIGTPSVHDVIDVAALIAQSASAVNRISLDEALVAEYFLRAPAAYPNAATLLEQARAYCATSPVPAGTDSAFCALIRLLEDGSSAAGNAADGTGQRRTGYCVEAPQDVDDCEPSPVMALRRGELDAA
jgi:hypothetical protein